ncbi:MAG: acetylxylan esterase [Planctomycetaceae bacterium]|nr:acetylxylan esterase [Planctomycetaceae bacterium]
MLNHRFVSIAALFLSLVFLSGNFAAQPNYDESKVPNYILPDPLTMQYGRKVTTPEQWTKERRPELLKLFEEHMFGKATLFRTGNTVFKTRFEYLSSKPVYDGKGIQHQFQIVWYRDNDEHRVDVLAYVPKSEKKVPAFIGLNFMGNHTVYTDPDIRIPIIWDRSKGTCAPGKENDRGLQAHRWTVPLFLERGYALVTAYYCNIEPDFNGGYRHGVRRFLYKEGEKQKPDEANTIATWAWGLSEMLDAIEHFQDKLGIDPTKMAVNGHSRLGKTALWAGAIDQRFAMVISNDSGLGGAALIRRRFGAPVQVLPEQFPHWCCENLNSRFGKSNPDVVSLPIDAHQLIALSAPRPVYIASATEDLWADPKGEFLSAFHADPVYRLLGTNGIGGVTEMPPPDQSVGGIIRYHVRTGKHDIVEFDWKNYCDFADKYLK